MSANHSVNAWEPHGSSQQAPKSLGWRLSATKPAAPEVKRFGARGADGLPMKPWAGPKLQPLSDLVNGTNEEKDCLARFGDWNDPAQAEIQTFQQATKQREELKRFEILRDGIESIPKNLSNVTSKLDELALIRETIQAGFTSLSEEICGVKIQISNVEKEIKQQICTMTRPQIKEDNHEWNQIDVDVLVKSLKKDIVKEWSAIQEGTYTKLRKYLLDKLGDIRRQLLEKIWDLQKRIDGKMEGSKGFETQLIEESLREIIDRTRKFGEPLDVEQVELAVIRALNRPRVLNVIAQCTAHHCMRAQQLQRQKLLSNRGNESDKGRRSTVDSGGMRRHANGATVSLHNNRGESADAITINMGVNNRCGEWWDGSGSSFEEVRKNSDREREVTSNTKTIVLEDFKGTVESDSHKTIATGQEILETTNVVNEPCSGMKKQSKKRGNDEETGAAAAVPCATTNAVRNTYRVKKRRSE